MCVAAIELLEERQKLIRLADASELGWRVVAEYRANPLAEDSEDEKRILKAEARATRKAKAERGKRSRCRSVPYEKPPAHFTQRSTPSATATATSTRPGSCFKCGKAGHWKLECPGVGGSNNKISFDYCKSHTSSYEPVCDVGKLVVNTPKKVGESLLVVGNGADGCLADKQASCSPMEVGEKLVSPVGRLKRNVSEWRAITDDSYMVSVIENGYKLPFKTLPTSVILKNNKSALENPDFVAEEIDRLLKKGVVKQVTEAPFVINPLTVAFGKGGNQDWFWIVGT